MAHSDAGGGINLAEPVPQENFQDYVFSVNVPEPSSEHEWRAIVKDPAKFVAKKVAKGVEVSWQKLNATQRAAMAEAKQVEIKSWLTSQVCKAALGDVPRERLMKMRWVLTFKPGSKEGEIKAKARLVVLGFTDPDAISDLDKTWTTSSAADGDASRMAYSQG